MLDTVSIRAFDGSLADAEGLLAVERATFDESPYSPSEVQVMLTRGPQRAWLAVCEEVIGFTVAFVTQGLAGRCWEIDLLAVHPEWTGRGVATRLIQTAAVHGAGLAQRARALVATNNPGSARAFTRAGFHRDLLCELFIFRPESRTYNQWAAVGITVRTASDGEEIARWLPGGVTPAAGESETGGNLGAFTLLLAERNGQPAGYAELVRVQTLLYDGAWIESLVASTPPVRAALVHEARNWAINAGLDEIGVVVPGRDVPLRETFRAAGFQSLGDFDWLVAKLPLPGVAAG